MASQHTHRKLADIAVNVAETGALPATSDRSDALTAVPNRTDTPLSW